MQVTFYRDIEQAAAKLANSVCLKVVQVILDCFHETPSSGSTQRICVSKTTTDPANNSMKLIIGVTNESYTLQFDGNQLTNYYIQLEY